MKKYLWISLFLFSQCWGDNETPTIDIPIPQGNNLPFKLKIVESKFQLPQGLHSGAEAVHDGKWLFLAGRTNGLHAFNDKDQPANFPESQQNTNVFVVDIKKEIVCMRSLHELGLSDKIFDALSVTSPQSYQEGDTLYIAGGYLKDTAGIYVTLDTLTAINVPKLMSWVVNKEKECPQKFIQQIHHLLFKVTGGYMNKIRNGKEDKNNPTLLIMGQDFEGAYFGTHGFQKYTEEIRSFKIINDCEGLRISDASVNTISSPNYHRRDLNVVPMIIRKHDKLTAIFVALSGVFYPPTDGIWTTPVLISSQGKQIFSTSDFKQGMNSYVSATLGAYSKKRREMYTILFGGLSYYNPAGIIKEDPGIPFINQVSTIVFNECGQFKQYLMDDQFPVVESYIFPDKPFFFGTGAQFFPVQNHLLPNDIIDFDRIDDRTLVGYIVGGIQSIVGETTDQFIQTAASPYIFKVYLEPLRKD